MDSNKNDIVNSLLDETKNNVVDRLKQVFTSHECMVLAKKCISDFKTIFTQLKATASMPTTTGLLYFFEKENEFLTKVNKLCEILRKDKKQVYESVGYLDGKGNVQFVRKISSILAYSKSNNPISLLKTGFSTNAKNIYNSLCSICTNRYGPNFASDILNSSKMLVEYDVTSIKDFLGYQSFFIRENCG